MHGYEPVWLGSATGSARVRTGKGQLGPEHKARAVFIVAPRSATLGVISLNPPARASTIFLVTGSSASPVACPRDGAAG